MFPKVSIEYIPSTCNSCESSVNTTTSVLQLYLVFKVLITIKTVSLHSGDHKIIPAALIRHSTGAEEADIAGTFCSIMRTNLLHQDWDRVLFLA